MTSAEIKAKQLALEEQPRTEEFEKQLEVKRKLEPVQDEAQRLKFMAQERRKTQEAKDEAARLAAEAAILEKVQNTVNDPEALSNRLLDFVDDSLKFIPSSILDEPLPIVPQPLPGVRFSKDPKTSRARKLFRAVFGCVSRVLESVSQSARFSPRFSGMFLGNVTQIARASIFQSVIGSKIAINTAALSWVHHVRIKFKTFSMNRPQIFISSDLYSSSNIWF